MKIFSFNLLFSSVDLVKNDIAKTRKGQLGLSILGALLALVIGALLTIPIVNAFLDSKRKTRVEATLQDMRTIIADAQRTFGKINDYGHLSTAVAVQSNVIPARLRVPGTNTALNIYNGNIVFATYKIAVDNDSTQFVYYNVAPSDCADIVFGVESLTRSIGISGVIVKPNDGVIDAALVAANCQNTGTPTGYIDLVIGRS